LRKVIGGGGWLAEGWRRVIGGGGGLAEVYKWWR
jgi:hypothetical protein